MTSGAPTAVGTPFTTRKGPCPISKVKSPAMRKGAKKGGRNEHQLPPGAVVDSVFTMGGVGLRADPTRKSAPRWGRSAVTVGCRSPGPRAWELGQGFPRCAYDPGK